MMMQMVWIQQNDDKDANVQVRSSTYHKLIDFKPTIWTKSKPDCDATILQVGSTACDRVVDVKSTLESN